MKGRCLKAIAGYPTRVQMVIFYIQIEEIEVGYEIVKPSNDEEIESKQKIEQIEGMQYLGVR